jgi:hypothetical protein
MTASRVLAFGALALVVTVVPAAAQSADDRGFVRGLGGVTFVSETGGLVAGGAGITAAKHVDVIAEIGHFTNVLPKSQQADIDAAAPALGSTFGRPLVIDLRARGWYGIGGVRVNSKRSGRASAFAEAMAGRARATSVIKATGNGADVSSGVERALGLPRTETHSIFTLCGGISIHAGPGAFELGYRYSRIQTKDPRINTGLIHGGFALRF